MEIPHVRPFGVLLVALAAAWSASLWAESIQRSIHVSVIDSAGAPVSSLGPADFIVREDKVAREVLRVTPATDPMQIVLLVDDSQASQDYVNDYRESLKAFVSAIAADTSVGGKHSISVVTVASRPTIRANYTSDVNPVLKTVSGIFPQSDSSSCMLDGIFEVSEGIVKRHAPRPVIIALTTEGPEVSSRSYVEVLEMLHQAGATLHVIGIGVATNRSIDRATVFGEGTETTGGRFDSVLSSQALTPALKRLADQLTHQYLVTYAHPDSLIPPDKVTVSPAKSAFVMRGTLVRDAIEERR
jgi:hypothetical protein